MLCNLQMFSSSEIFEAQRCSFTGEVGGMLGQTELALSEADPGALIGEKLRTEEALQKTYL